MRVCLLLMFICAAVCAQQDAPSSSGNDLDRRFALAESSMKAGRSAEAAEELEKIVRLQPSFAKAYFDLGVCYTRLGKLGEAIAALQSCVKLEPKFPVGYALLGMLLLDVGRITEARPVLEHALRLDSSQTEAAKGLGCIYNLEGDNAKAIALLRPLAESGAADDESRTILARAFLGIGDSASAVKILEAVLAANPRSPLQTYVLAAMAARDAHDFPKAFEICERAMAVYPNSEQLETLAVSFPPEALRARTAQRLGEIEKNPNNAPALIAVGRMMVAEDKGERGRDLDLGCELLSRATTLDPKNAAAWFHYGRCFKAQIGKADEAEAAFNKALSFVHDDELRVLILEQVGSMESHFNRVDTADEAFRKSLELNRKLDRHIPESAYHYYRFLAQRGRDAEGRPLLDEILRWDPLFAPALLERAKSFLSNGEPERAAADALMITRNFEDPEILHSAHYLLLRIYHVTGDKSQAKVHTDWLKSHPQTAEEGEPASAP
jgi:tetratricopeptide (TPR) repeat protein